MYVVARFMQYMVPYNHQAMEKKNGVDKVFYIRDKFVYFPPKNDKILKY
jgi:hypothetical protein